MTVLPAPGDGSAPGYYGVYPAVVTAVVDPERLGRVEVRFPWLGADGDRDVRAWATLCTPYAGPDQGFEFLPEPGSQVVVAFEAGSLRRPYVVGCAWNGTAAPPEPPQASNHVRVIRTRSGSRLEFDDDPAGPRVTVQTAAGHGVVLDDSASGEVTVVHASGTTIRLTATSVEVSSGLDVSVAAVQVEVDAPMTTFTGVVRCAQLVADSGVVSPSYSPGAGNLQ